MGSKMTLMEGNNSGVSVTDPSKRAEWRTAEHAEHMCDFIFDNWEYSNEFYLPFHFEELPKIEVKQRKNG